MNFFVTKNIIICSIQAKFFEQINLSRDSRTVNYSQLGLKKNIRSLTFFGFYLRFEGNGQ